MKNGNHSLLEAFNNTTYQVSGHGKRNVQVLKDAFDDADGNMNSDMYGNGKPIEEFQEKMAKYLGKPSAVFFPSGTMAQQIALRIWCDRIGIKKVAYHPLSHLEIHEQDGLKQLHHIETVLLADKERTIELEDVLNMKEDVACVLLELPQREIGGQLPTYEDLEAISAHCRAKGIKLHLDGARLFEILPYYRKTASEICGLFDSVYVSLYKGIGGIAGAILAGDEDFTSESKIWKRRHGGDLISLYPYILSADKYFDQRVSKMDTYYEGAKELAELFNECHAISTKPSIPVSNMFHVHADMPKERFESALTSVHEQSGIGISPYVNSTSDTACYLEISIGDRYEAIPKAELKKALRLLDETMKKLFR
ncbi:aminotransferase class I/II-fold pyridoxal phosphate-dependent enzyme [Cohnella endophytica]|uniref:Aminotransferase class I/II-fold pyridoxal phosphate-dependent enzyme n=1 Tax=Cohnella endophytica TaxID=2419778 RepID=A0A494Y915_9BACL|nr:aminotransferase class I/II-fold pyridoxal phosphate-dependent enzyme [Cohnella endophytica]RKP58108.1 aminotransferase class I/II-fold pyridoxal phosphate-dependent enzyme [Cohnella endophytica]